MTDLFSYYKKLERLAIEILMITGYTLEELKDKLMAGWELTPPKELFSMSMIDLEKMMEEGE